MTVSDKSLGRKTSQKHKKFLTEVISRVIHIILPGFILASLIVSHFYYGQPFFTYLRNRTMIVVPPRVSPPCVSEVKTRSVMPIFGIPEPG